MIRSLFALALLLIATPARAEAPLERSESSAWMLGLHYDQGKASAFGLSALHAWEGETSRGGLGGAAWFAAGIDGRVVTRGFHDLDGGLGYAVARFSGLGDAGGGGLELGTGAGFDAHHAFPVAEAGVFFSVYYVDLGYSYQFQLPSFTRPDWLSSHQFSVRVHVPVHRYHRHVWYEPAPNG